MRTRIIEYGYIFSATLLVIASLFYLVEHEKEAELLTEYAQVSARAYGIAEDIQEIARQAIGTRFNVDIDEMTSINNGYITQFDDSTGQEQNYQLNIFVQGSSCTGQNQLVRLVEGVAICCGQCDADVRLEFPSDVMCSRGTNAWIPCDYSTQGNVNRIAVRCDDPYAVATLTGQHGVLGMIRPSAQWGEYLIFPFNVQFSAGDYGLYGVCGDRSFRVIAPVAGGGGGGGSGSSSPPNNQQPGLPNQPPVAVLIVTPQSGIAPLTVQFDGGLSYDDDGTIAAYSWTLNNVPLAQTQPIFSRTLESGNHIVRLTVTDNRGATHYQQASITVDGIQVPVCGNGIIEASESCDDGNLINGDGCSSTCQITRQCSDGVDNDGDGLIDYPADPGCSGAMDNSELDNPNPPPDAFFIATPTQGSIPLLVQFNASLSSDDGGIVSYRWDFNGDGTVDSTTIIPTTSFTYQTQGQYLSRLTVVDTLGATDVYDVLITATGTISDPGDFVPIPTSGSLSLSSSVNLGSVESASRISTIIPITYAGTVAVTQVSLSLSEGPFSITSTTCGQTVNQNCSVTVSYLPSQIGIEQAQLTLSYTGPTGAQQRQSTISGSATRNQARKILIVYNTNSAESLLLKDYYINNRPGMTSANVVGIATTDADAMNPADYISTIRDPIVDWMNNNPGETIKYIVLMRGVPSRFAISPNTNNPHKSVQTRLENALIERGDVPQFNAPYNTHANVPFEQGEYPGTLALITHMDMGSVEATQAYIDKLANVHSQMENPSVIISGQDAGIIGDTYYCEDVWNIYGQSTLVAQARCLDVTAEFSEISTQYRGYNDAMFSEMENVRGYITWGANGRSRTVDYAINGELVFTGTSNWYPIMTVESFNGIRHADAWMVNTQGNYEDWYSADAFGGKDYQNTPAGAVGHTHEPGLSGINSVKYFTRWEQGWKFADVAWNTRLASSGHFRATGDPYITR